MFLPHTCWIHSMASSASNLLVTGSYRSGTTLIEKLLHSHDNICLGSQPFPILYFHIKQAFLDSIHVERRYPLDHLFLESRYVPEDLNAFLDHHRLTSSALDQIFVELSDYQKGLWTPEILGFRRTILGFNQSGCTAQLCQFSSQIPEQLEKMENTNIDQSR